VGLGYVLLPAGRMRNWVKLASAGLVGLFVLAQLYLAVDHPTDIAYPVVYALHRQTAHLDVTGARGEAIRRAAREQLGLLVVSVKSFGLGGSAGSTPLRLRLDGKSPTYVFAKLYARNHLRADRWYKLGRSVLYGSLEDEAPFETVRRLVQYED
jgi:hypothetical protein